MDNEKHIVPRKGGFSVAASPFNSVKFELGIVLLVAVIVLSVASMMISDENLQFMILLGYGVLSALWIGLRVRQVASKSGMKADNGEK